MGAISVRSTSGAMGVVVFTIGAGAFLFGFVEPLFAPIAWVSLAGGVAAAVLRRDRNGSRHPTISHLAVDPEATAPRSGDERGPAREGLH